MNTLSYLIARRYLRGVHHEKSIAQMASICFLGILIGSFSLALVMAVMNGFEKVTHEKFQGIHAQVIIRSHGDQLNVEELSAVLQHEFPDIAATSSSTYKQVIIQHVRSKDISNVVMLKGIEPQREEHVSALATYIKKSLSDKSLPAMIHDNYIVVGEKLAQALEVAPGDPVTLLFTNEQSSSRKLTLHQTKAVIGGTFASGIDEFDQGLIICSMDFLTQNFPDTGPTHIYAKLKPHANEHAIIQKLQQRLGLEVYSWKDLYPALVSALTLEKYVMFFILALITLVASMNIISLLFMQIIQKQGDVAILQAMGLASTHIRYIFLFMGLQLTFFATTLGLALATLTSWILERFQCIKLPDAYYVTHLPAKMEWQLLIFVFLVIMALSFGATWFSTRRVRSINIAEVLRFDT